MNAVGTGVRVGSGVEPSARRVTVRARVRVRVRVRVTSSCCESTVHAYSP